ncbi:MAG: HAD-IIIA family hydrolase [Myxococcota bacterium]|nr:HAD-IIIA family hydrolase [Myxococcota bacterium]
MARKGHRGLLVDLDGTVRTTRSGRPHPVKAWDQVIRPGVEARLREFKERRFKIVGVTNQGGVAFGYLTELDVEAVNRHLEEELLPGVFELILYCPFHPKGQVGQYRKDSQDRKPNPGMAIKAQASLGLDLSRSVMIGDMESDRHFARNAGIPDFLSPEEAFGPNPHPRLAQLLEDPKSPEAKARTASEKVARRAEAASVRKREREIRQADAQARLARQAELRQTEREAIQAKRAAAKRALAEAKRAQQDRIRRAQDEAKRAEKAIATAGKKAAAEARRAAAVEIKARAAEARRAKELRARLRKDAAAKRARDAAAKRAKAKGAKSLWARWLG